MLNKRIQFAGALLWTVIVTVLSLMKFGDMGGSVNLPYKDKMVHFVFYFLFVLLWFNYKKSEKNQRRTGFGIFIAAVVYGLLMEVCQSLFDNGRTADLYDAMANTLGATMALLLINCRIINKRRP